MVTPTEKRQLRRLASLLVPFGPMPDFSPTPEEQAEQARLDAERREVEQELAEFRREHPKLAAREDEMYERMDRKIRERVFRRDTITR